MPQPKTVDQVAWLPPELYPDLAPGQYRTVPDSGDPLDGELVVWVDDKPESAEDGSGHFESYVGKADSYEYNTRTAYLREKANEANA